MFSSFLQYYQYLASIFKKKSTGVILGSFYGECLFGMCKRILEKMCLKLIQDNSFIITPITMCLERFYPCKHKRGYHKTDYQHEDSLGKGYNKTQCLQADFVPKCFSEIITAHCVKN